MKTRSVLQASLSRIALVVLAVLLLACAVQARELRQSIRFAPGASSATVHGAVIRGDRDVYELKASAGQTMEVAVTALEHNVAFVLHAPDKKTLPGAGEGEDATSWKGTLPASGVYRITVGGTRGNAEYTVTVAIR